MRSSAAQVPSALLRATFEVSIVIPAYNEEQRLARTLPQVTAFMDRQPGRFELIVVDDGSTDGTFLAARRMLRARADARVLRYVRNQGKGFAVRTGVLESRGHVVLFTDADLSTPLAEMEKGLAALADGYAVAIGSRAVPLARIERQQPLYRRLGARIFKEMVYGWLRLREFQDTQCGFKLFKREAALALFGSQRVRGFMFDVEILCRARRAGLRVKEYPVAWANDPDSRLRVVSDTARMFKDLWWIRFFT